MIRLMIVGLLLLACSIATPLAAAGRYDGQWQGRATLVAGASGCPKTFNFRVAFSDSKISGIANSGGVDYKVEGDLTGLTRLKAIVYGSIGLANFTARFRNDRWRGHWEAVGECDGDWYLERVK